MISQVIEKLHSGRVPQVGRAARPATLLQGSGKAVCVLTGGAGHSARRRSVLRAGNDERADGQY